MAASEQYFETVARTQMWSEADKIAIGEGVEFLHKFGGPATLLFDMNDKPITPVTRKFVEQVAACVGRSMIQVGKPLLGMSAIAAQSMDVLYEGKPDRTDSMVKKNGMQIFPKLQK